MSRVATLSQLVLLPIVMVVLLVMVPESGVRAMPRSGDPIMFLDDRRFGTSWDRFLARASRPVVRTSLTERDEDPGRAFFSPRNRHQLRRQERLRLAPTPRFRTKSKPVHRRRSSGSSSAIIFPGQPGYDLPHKEMKRPTERPVNDAPGVEFGENAGHETPLEETPAKEDELELPECGGVPFRALDVASGNCRPLAMRSGCPPDQWFVLDRVTRQADCRPHPCKIGFAILNGSCHNLTDSSVCPPNMVLQVDEFGDASCDCARGCVYWPPAQRCFPALLRGPCEDGQQLTANAEGPACVKNPCGRDGWARWPETGVCHPLRDVNDAPCPHGRMEVDSMSLELVCNDAVANSVFSTPSVRCAVGSRRALSGRCKRAIRSGSSPLRFIGNRCASGFIETPDGACRRSGGFGSLG